MIEAPSVSVSASISGDLSWNPNDCDEGLCCVANLGEVNVTISAGGYVSDDGPTCTDERGSGSITFRVFDGVDLLNTCD